jgi:hypothetical protein
VSTRLCFHWAGRARQRRLVAISSQLILCRQPSRVLSWVTVRGLAHLTGLGDLDDEWAAILGNAVYRGQ